MARDNIMHLDIDIIYPVTSTHCLQDILNKVFKKYKGYIINDETRALATLDVINALDTLGVLKPDIKVNKTRDDVIHCPKCKSGDVVKSGNKFGCMNCKHKFTKEHLNRLFKASEYELEFGSSIGKFVEQYRGYDIYSYNVFESTKYTFWHGSEDSEYISWLDTLKKCHEMIHDFQQNK